MLELPNLPPSFLGSANQMLVDNFNVYSSGGTWTTVADNSGTIATGNFTPSGILFTTGGADNNYAYTYATNYNYIMTAARPCVAEFIFKYTEVATTGHNVVMGFTDSAVAGSLVSNGAGVAASFSGAQIYKVDGGSAWKVTSSVGTTQSTNTVKTLVPGAGVLTRARVEIRYVNGGAEITYWMGGVNPLGSSTSNPQMGQLLDATTGRPIKHTISSTTLASAAQMSPLFGIKAGTGAAYTAYLHRVAAAQKF